MDLTDAQWAVIEPLIPKPRWPSGTTTSETRPSQTRSAIDCSTMLTGSCYKDLPGGK